MSNKLVDELIESAVSIGITGHVRPDGDCVGSTLGLYNYITERYPDKKVEVFLESVGADFNYINGVDKVCNEPKDDSYDVFFVLDCSTKDRILPFCKSYDNAKHTVCIDHHVTNAGFADESFINSQASSTCEVLYGMLDKSGISKSVAECLYTGIIHDTGVFKYSCTSKETMAIAGELMEKGIDYSSIIDNTFYKKTYIQNQILGRALLESVLFYYGKCIFSVIGKDVMDFYGVTGADLGGVVEQLRLTDGVEVAIFMYYTDENEYKVSMRSKNYIDVAKIAMNYNGGGHAKAAGFTARGTVHQIINGISDMLEEQFKEKEQA